MSTGSSSHLSLGHSSSAASQPDDRSQINRRNFLIAGALAGSIGARSAQSDNASPRAEVSYRKVDIRGLSVFYREAGPKSAPTLLLLHGFPSSSFMFRALIPLLADRYHIVAPDYPGFGFSTAPHPRDFEYSFSNLTRVVREFTEQLGLSSYALYIQDYGAPIGLRLALQAPERVTALIVQNGNAYEEGLSAEWDALRQYWRDPTAQNRETLRGWLNSDGIRLQYLAGVPERDHHRFSPETWTLDWALLQRSGLIDAQLDLFGDYQSNVQLYGHFQTMFRERRFPTLITWGERDVFFTTAGARAYLRDLPRAQLHLLDAGHFALETHHAEIAFLIRQFLPAQAPDASSPP